MLSADAVTLARWLELPARPSDSGVVLGYGYSPGMTLVYRSVATLRRNQDEPIELESRITVKVIDRDEADEGTFIIVYDDPRRRRVGARQEPLGPRSIVYTKQNDFGEVLESTASGGGANLLLPRMAVAAGSTWREIERFLPPGRLSAVERVRAWRVVSVSGHALMVFEAEPCIYALEAPPSTEGRAESSEATLEGHGSFTFDVEWGVVTRQAVETRVTSSERGLAFTLRTTHTMELVDE
jgi:hypothetical protein